MSAEFSARYAREITDNKEYDIEKWYAKYKDELFYQIQTACMNGHDHLMITNDQWNNKELYKQHLINRLTDLGYQTNSRYKDLVISW